MTGCHVPTDGRGGRWQILERAGMIDGRFYPFQDDSRCFVCVAYSPAVRRSRHSHDQASLSEMYKGCKGLTTFLYSLFI